MAKRPAQGRGSGGRVTPSTRSSPGASNGGGKSRARMLQSEPGKGSAKARSTPRTGGSGGSGPTGGPGGSTRTKGAGSAPVPPDDSAPNEAGRGDRPAAGRQGFSLARLLDPLGTAKLPAAERPRPWWGFGDVMAWFLIGQVAALMLNLFVAQRGGYALDRPTGPGARLGEATGRVGVGQPPGVTPTWADMPLWLSQGVAQLPLWAAFIGGSVFATVRKGFGPVRDLKIAFRPVDVPIGLGVGIACQVLLNPLVYRVLFLFTPEQDVSRGARGITDKATSPLLVLLLFVTVGLLAPVAEELFFRGLALQSLVRRFGRVGGLILSSAFFAIAHTNPLYFVALMPFALILGWLVLRFDRLGPSIVAHVSYNLVTATVLVFGIELPW
jgi:membrane protease YdiL (CAAX protease family)